MEEAKKTNEPVIIVQQPPPAYNNNNQKEGGWKTSGNVRMLIVAFAVITVTAMIITGFVLGFKYHADTTKHALSNKEHVKDGDLDETVESDDAGLTKLYTVRTDEGSYFVLYDYAKNIRIMKSDDHCVVTPMNSSESDPESEYRHGSKNNGDYKLVFKRDNMPVRDTSFLGTEGQKLCDGQLVYWGMPQCQGSDDEMEISNSTEVGEPGRQKRSGFAIDHVQNRKYWCRAASGNRCCITSCGWQVCHQCVTLYRVVYLDTVRDGYHFHCHFVYGC
jgi:hypothetical protein